MQPPEETNEQGAGVPTQNQYGLPQGQTEQSVRA